MGNLTPVSEIDYDLGITSTPEDPVNDSFPGLLIGISSMVGTAWWIITWFVYIKN